LIASVTRACFNTRKQGIFALYLTASGGCLHDIGKVGVPDAVLLKSGPLTADEHAQMRAHTIIGERLCGELRTLRRVRPIITAQIGRTR